MTLVKRVVSQYGVERMEPVSDFQVTPPPQHNCMTDGHLYASASGGLGFVGLNNGDCINCRKSKKEIDSETLKFATRVTEAFNTHKKETLADRVKALKKPVAMLVSDSYTLDVPFGIKYIAPYAMRITELRHPLMDTVKEVKLLMERDSLQMGYIPEDLRAEFIAPVDGVFGFQHGKGAQYVEMKQGQQAFSDHNGWLHAEFDDCPMADDSDELVDNCDMQLAGKALDYNPGGTKIVGYSPPSRDVGHRQVTEELFDAAEAAGMTTAYMNNHQLRTDNDRLREQLAKTQERLQKSQALVDEQARKLSYLESRCEAHAKTIAGMRQERGPGIQHKPTEPIQTCHMGDYYED